jgi:hypothetical protein
MLILFMRHIILNYKHNNNIIIYYYYYIIIIIILLLYYYYNITVSIESMPRMHFSLFGGCTIIAHASRNLNLCWLLVYLLVPMNAHIKCNEAETSH